jgi:predicted phage terminase large subunit-like protein
MPFGKKLAIAQEATPWIESGYVFLPANRPDIVNAVLDECTRFTHNDTHLHDDIVDNIAYAVRYALASRMVFYPLPYGDLAQKHLNLV